MIDKCDDNERSKIICVMIILFFGLLLDKEVDRFLVVFFFSYEVYYSNLVLRSEIYCFCVFMGERNVWLVFFEVGKLGWIFEFFLFLEEVRV